MLMIFAGRLISQGISLPRQKPADTYGWHALPVVDTRLPGTDARTRVPLDDRFNVGK